MIDAISLEILKILQEKARIPNIEVSRQVGLAPSAVLERIRKMEKQGRHRRLRGPPQSRAFSPLARSPLSRSQTTTAACSEVGRQLALIPEVQEVHFVAGNDCYLIKVGPPTPSNWQASAYQDRPPSPGSSPPRPKQSSSTIKETSPIPIPE